MDTLKQTNILATGGIDRSVRIWGVEGEGRGLNLLREVKVDGIITDLKLEAELLAVA